MKLYSVMVDSSGFADPVSYDNDTLARSAFLSFVPAAVDLVPGVSASDFKLYHVADFDLETGVVTVPSECPRFLVRGFSKPVDNSDSSD